MRGATSVAEMGVDGVGATMFSGQTKKKDTVSCVQNEKQQGLSCQNLKMNKEKERQCFLFPN